MNPIEIKYQEHDLDGIMRYFFEGFKAKPGEKIVRYEFVVDVFTRKVVYKFYIEREPTIQPM